MQSAMAVAEDLVAALPALPALPRGLAGCWRRAYIRQSFREPRATDSVENSQAGVRYLQLECGLCVDIRLDVLGGDPGCTDCFLGLARWDERAQVLEWHPVVSSGADPPGQGEQQLSLGERLRARARELGPGGAAADALAEDRGRLEWADADRNAWLEYDVDSGAAVLEERWERDAEEPEDAVGPGQRSLSARPELALASDGELLLARDGRFAHAQISEGRPPRFRCGTVARGGTGGAQSSDPQFRVQLDSSWDPQGLDCAPPLLDTALSRAAAKGDQLRRLARVVPPG